jgi:hypothetical protein
MSKRFDPMQTALSAVRNASQVPVSAPDVIDILSTGTGAPSHVRALFGDVSLGKLMELSIEAGVSNERLAESYRLANRRYAASSAELDEFVAHMERS